MLPALPWVNLGRGLPWLWIRTLMAWLGGKEGDGIEGLGYWGLATGAFMPLFKETSLASLAGVGRGGLGGPTAEVLGAQPRTLRALERECWLVRGSFFSSSSSIWLLRPIVWGVTGLP